MLQIILSLQNHAYIRCLLSSLQGEDIDAGNHSLVWEGAGGDGQKLSSGLYICRLIAGNYHSALKMVLAR